MFTHYLKLWDRFIPHIANGSKDLDVRVGHKGLSKIKAGDRVVFAGIHTRTVIAIRRYSTFKDMLLAENPKRILPGASAETVLGGLRRIYPPQKETLGVIVIEFTKTTVAR